MVALKACQRVAGWLVTSSIAAMFVIWRQKHNTIVIVSSKQDDTMFEISVQTSTVRLQNALQH